MSKGGGASGKAGAGRKGRGGASSGGGGGGGAKRKLANRIRETEELRGRTAKPGGAITKAKPKAKRKGVKRLSAADRKAVTKAKSAKRPSKAQRELKLAAGVRAGLSKVKAANTKARRHGGAIGALAGLAAASTAVGLAQS
jgi:hypothetical protein